MATSIAMSGPFSGAKRPMNASHPSSPCPGGIAVDVETVVHDVAHPELGKELRLPARDRHGRDVGELAVVLDELLDALVMEA